MRHYITLWLLAAAVVLSAGCGVLGRTSEEKRAEEARAAERVRENLDARRFKMVVEFMYPLRGGSRAVTSPYSVTVDGDGLISHLPYVGTAWEVPYGGGKVLSFEDKIEEYGDGVDERGRRVIAFTTDNDEDYIIYRMTVFDNGKADLQVRCRHREEINYRGYIDPDPLREEEE